MKNKQSALLVIDMQLVAFDGKITPPVPNGSQLLAKVSTLIDRCRALRTPVIFIQTCALSEQPYAKDTHGWEIHPQVAPNSSESVFHKVGPSAFENPDLHEQLNELGAQEVIVCGIWSEGCVTHTCDSALELGYDVSLVADCHGTVRDSESKALAVVREQNDKLKRKGANVYRTRETLENLLI